MTPTLYTQYVRDLKATVDRVRDQPSMFESATIQLAIYRNGFAYESTDLLQRRCVVSKYRIGPVHGEAWKQDDGTASRTEIENFFQLPEIYAYSDLVLTIGQSPLQNAHWDATIGLVDVLVTTRDGSTKKQRMLFIGFTDAVHAEFSLAVDDALLVHDHRAGSRFFEWTEEGRQPSNRENPQPTESPVATRPKRRWAHLKSTWWGDLVGRKSAT
jgi:hypothetical protein